MQEYIRQLRQFTVNIKYDNHSVTIKIILTVMPIASSNKII